MTPQKLPEDLAQAHDATWLLAELSTTKLTVYLLDLLDQPILLADEIRHLPIHAVGERIEARAGRDHPDAVALLAIQALDFRDELVTPHLK